MTVQEAIKFEKPFKRPSWNYYITDFKRGNFQLEDVMADDWEIKEPSVEITKSEFYVAFAEVLQEDGITYSSVLGKHPINEIDLLGVSVITRVAEKLGLK